MNQFTNIPPAGRLGYYLPWAIFGSIMTSIGTGLLSMLSPTTSTRDWAGFQAIVGLGRGAATQVVRLSPHEHPPSPLEPPN